MLWREDTMRSSRRLTWGGSIINQSSSRARSCLRRTASTSPTMARRSSMRSMKCLCWTRPPTLEDILKWVSLQLLLLLEEEDGVLHLLLHLPTSLKQIHFYRDE